MADLIKFNKGSQAGYDALTAVSTEIYITTDTGKIYLGDKLLGDYDSNTIKDVTISTVVDGVATFTFTKEDDSTFTRTLTLSTVKPYVGENAIVVDDSATDKNVISLTIKAGEKVLNQDINGLFSTISIVKEDTPPEGLASQYKLVGSDGETALGVTIDIVKDQLIGGVEYIHKATQEDVDKAIERNSVIELGKSYVAIEFLLGETAIRWTYVDVTDLIDVYTAGDGLQLIDNEFSVKIDPASESNSDDVPVSYLTVSSDGIKLSGINAELEKKLDIDDLPNEFDLTAATDQPISVGGSTSAVTTTINSSVVTSTGGLQVTGGALATKIDNTTTNVTLSTDESGLKASLSWGEF